MTSNWRGAITRRLVLLIAACLTVGVITGEYAWAIAIGLAAHLLWNLSQLLVTFRSSASRSLSW